MEPTPQQVHVDGYGSPPSKKSKKQRKKQRKREKRMAKFDATVGIFKAANDKHLIYGVVLEPDLVDSQGDEVGPEEIEKAAHRFLKDSRQHDLQHSEEVVESIYPVESYIAQTNFKVGKEQVTKGSWVIVLKVEDDAVWQDIKDGKYTGLSIGGSAIRV